MNKILVPVDFSNNSLNALHYALALFANAPVELTLLNTFGIKSSAAFHMKSVDRVLEDDAKKEMEALSNQVKNAYPNISLHSKIVNGGAITTITSLGNSGEYDFIVMGTKGASGLKKVFVGSVAGGVIARTDTPVIIVPDNYELDELDEITFAMGNIQLSDPQVIQPLHQLVDISKAKINVLHIAEEQSPGIEDQLAAIHDLEPEVRYQYGHSKVNEFLKGYLSDQHPDMLCLIRSKKDIFGQLFQESVTMEQTFSSPVPLMILQN